MTKVDWAAPLEAFHDDGRVVPADFLCHASGATADVRFDGRHENALKPSGYVGQGWRIRNVAAPEQRMVSLMRKIAAPGTIDRIGRFEECREEARTILAEIDRGEVVQATTKQGDEA